MQNGNREGQAPFREKTNFPENEPDLLFDGDGFGEVSGFVDVAVAEDGGVVGQ